MFVVLAKIDYNTFINSQHAMTTSSGLIQVSRALTRLAAVFLSFDQSTRQQRYRAFNNFHYPGDVLELQLQVGSNKFPEMKMNSRSECFAKLRDTCRDLQPLAAHGTVYGITASSITPAGYMGNEFTVGINTEKIEGAASSGLNMKDGSVMSLGYKIPYITSSNINSMYFTMLAGHKLEIRNAGVVIYD